MKKTLVTLTLLLAAIISQAQNVKTIDSFSGIKFGATMAQVKAAMRLKGGKLDVAHSTKKVLIFDNVSVGRRKAVFTYVKLVGDKAFEAGYKFLPTLEPKTIDYYNDLVSDINGVYGEGEGRKNFKSPYEDGDGYEITALQTGNAEYITYWGGGDDEQPGMISVSIDVSDDKLLVKLTYQDKKLVDIAVKAQEEQMKSDL